MNEDKGEVSSGAEEENSNEGNAKSKQKNHRHYKNKRHKFREHFNADGVSEEQFYENLIKLREEHKQTLKLLETKYYNELKKQTSFQWEGFEEGVGLREYGKNTKSSVGNGGLQSSQDNIKDMSHFARTNTVDIAQNSHEYNPEELCDSEDEIEKDKHLGIIPPEEFSISLYPKRSQAMEMVEHLWQDFSIQDYATNDEILESLRVEKSEKEKEWTPSITVPKPFMMTLREAKREKKTRSMQMLQDELNLKKSMEEAELKKKFRAQPVPATTFLPLYDDIIEKNERRSKHIREINKAILKATEKPFSFTKREEIKKQQKEEKRRQKMLEKNDEKDQRIFRAQPPPKHENDLSLADRLTEQEEYRKIRHKLRSLELLANSRLPPSMEARNNVTLAAKSRQKCRKSRAPKPRFRPNINAEVPDFDALHWEFEKELRKRKKERQPTVVEPFDLKTAHIPRFKSSLRRARSMESLRHSNRGDGDCGKRSRNMRASSARLSSSQDTLPFGTTETVRLRDNAVKRSLDVEKQRYDETRKARKAKKTREKQLRSQVTVKAMANDQSWQLRKSSETKLKNFREHDRGRQEEYERELSEMQRRVEQRPLLFERESQVNAKRKAEMKYTQILRDAGVHEELVNSLVTKHRDVIDSEGDTSDVEVYSGIDDDERINSTSDHEKVSDLEELRSVDDTSEGED